MPQAASNPEAPHQPGLLLPIVKEMDNGCLLANFYETLASDHAMVSNLAFDLEGSPHRFLFGELSQRGEYPDDTNRSVMLN
ncbi:DUF6124 family protein [Pseudomonas sp. D3-10]|uniref:DUF6124 family protein n=1 Tax=Pseudomonas sp. D3-10 TaxID=2817392 RepID=UPI003DA8F0BF